LRYEDVALDPKSYAKKIYEKFNLHYPENIDSWINQNTHNDQKSGKMNIYDTRRFVKIIISRSFIFAQN